MRTLKKTLCLVLALVMVLGVCAFGASAEFTDAAEINYAEAVAVLSGIGVINGIEDADGNFAFQPAGTLTRAQAAKIIAYLLKADETELGTKSTFTDAQGHWAEGVIAYAAAKGIVAGVGDNMFNPEGKLTGFAFAKMLLCAIGYDAATEGMVGDAWAINVATLAKNANLLAGIEKFDGNADCSREQACQMAFNALKANMVKYEGGSTVEVNGVTIKTGATLKATTDKLQDAFNLKTASATTENGLGGYVYTAGAKDEVVTPAMSDWELLYTVKSGDTFGSLAKELGIKATSTDKAWEIEDGMFYGYSYDMKNIADSARANDPAYAAGLKQEIYVSRDITKTTNKYAIVLTYTYACELAESSVKETAGEHKGEYKWTVGPCTVYAAAKDAYKGIYAFTLGNDGEGNYKLLSCDKVEAVTAKATKVSDYSVTVNGVAYANNTGSSFTTALLSAEKEYYIVDDAVYAVKDPAGAVVVPDVVYVVDTYFKSATTTDEYGKETTTETYYVQCVDMEGKEVSYQTEDSGYGSAVAGGLMQVTVAYNNTVKAECATFGAATGAKTATETLAATAKKLADGTYFKSDVKFVYVDGSLATLKITVKEGVQVLDAKAIEYVATTEGANKTTSVVFVEAAYTEPTKLGEGIVFVNGDAVSTVAETVTDKDGKSAVGYAKTVYIDGEKKTVYVAAAAAIADGFYTYEENGDLVILASKTDAALKTPADITAVYEAQITVSGLTDAAVAGAKLVCLDTTDVVEAAEDLMVGDKVAIVMDGTAIAIIYVVDAVSRG